MSFQLTYRESLSQGVRRLIADECSSVRETILRASSPEDNHEAIHVSRTSFKKIRAALRLVRENFEYYDRENQWFSERGKEISTLRDATATLELVQWLSDQDTTNKHETIFGKLTHHLREARDKLAVKKINREKLLERLESKLEIKMLSIADWSFPDSVYGDIRGNIEQIYEQGQIHLLEVMNNSEPERMHAFRKKAKYMRYQIEMLNRIWPPVMESLEHEFQTISDMAGTLHDLENLRLAIQEGETFLSRGEKRTVNSIINGQHKSLTNRLLLLAQKLYAETPGNFCDRLEIYWAIHEREIKLIS